MYDDILRRGVARVWRPTDDPGGKTLGTAFLVHTDGLLVTCAHVLEKETGALDGSSPVHLTFLASRLDCTAKALPQYVRSSDKEDVAILQLESPTEFAEITSADTDHTTIDLAHAPPLVLPLGYSVPARDAKLNEPYRLGTYGFPRAKPDTGLPGIGEVIGTAQDNGFDVLTLRAGETSHGYSGGPVWDETIEAVVGMNVSIVKPGTDLGGKHRDTAFVIPVETIRNVCDRLSLRSGAPYRRLEFFDDDHAAFYFGREALSRKLADLITSHDFAAIVGVSGSGKSSLVRAGLINGLKGTQSPVIDYARIHFRPGPAPFASLFNALTSTNHPSVTPQHVADAFGLVAGFGASPHELADHLSNLSTDQLIAALRLVGESTPLLLICDQFERLFAECLDSAVQSRFIATLLGAACPSVKVAIAVRADYYGHVLGQHNLGRAVESAQLTVFPMSDDDLRAIILRPASKLFRHVQSSAVDAMVREVSGRAGDLPLLEFALTELWDRDQSKGVLTLKSYSQLGFPGRGGQPPVSGVQGALVRRAEDYYRKLNTQGERECFYQLFRLLIVPASPTPYAAQNDGRPVLEPELDERTRELALRLADTFLLTTGIDALTGAQTFEVVHDVLIRSWPRLEELRSDETAWHLWYHRILFPSFQQWLARERKPEFYLQNKVLIAEAERWLAETGRLASPAVQTFVSESVQAEHERVKAEEERARRELQMQRRQSRRFLVTAAAASALAVVACGLAIWANSARNDADAARTDAVNANAKLDGSLKVSHQRLVDQLTSNGGRSWDASDYFSALGWFASALREDEKRRPQEAAVHRARIISSLNFTPKLDRILDHDTDVTSAEFDSHGKRVVTSAGGRIRIWNRDSGTMLGQSDELDEPIIAARFIGEGDRLLTIARSAAIVYDAKLLTELQRFESPSLVVVNGWADQAGRKVLLIVVDEEGTTMNVVCWDPDAGRSQTLPTPESKRQLLPPAYFTYLHVALSADGRWAALCQFHAEELKKVGAQVDLNLPGYIGIWDTTSGKLYAEQAAGASVRSISLAHGKQQVAAVTADDRLQLWDFTNQQKDAEDDTVFPLRQVWSTPTALPAGATNAEFNEDDTNLGIVHANGWAQVQSKDGSSLTGNNPLLEGVISAARGQHTITSSQRYYLGVTGSRVEIYDAAGFYPGIGRLLAPKAFTMTLSPIGGMAATWEITGRLTLWTNLGDPRGRFLADGTEAYTFSPTRPEIVYAAANKVSFVSAAGEEIGEPIQLPEKREKAVSLLFSGDGNKLAVFTEDSIRVFESTEHREVLALPQALVQGEERPAEPIPTAGRFQQPVFSPDGGRLAAIAADAIRIFDLKTREVLVTLRPRNEAMPFQGLQYSPDGSFLLTKNGNPSSDVAQLHLWRAGDGTFIRTVNEAVCSPQGVFRKEVLWGFGSDSRTVYAKVASKSTIGVFTNLSVQHWRTSDGEPLKPLMEPAAMCSLLVLNDTAKVMLQQVGGRGTNTVYIVSYWRRDEPNARLSVSITAPFPPLCALSSDGRLIAVSEGSSVRVWDTETGSPVTPILDHDAAVSVLQFEPGTRRLLSMEMKVTRAFQLEWCDVRIWELDSPLPSSKLVELAQWVGGSREKGGQLLPIERKSLAPVIQGGAGTLLHASASQAIYYHAAQAAEREKTLDWDQAAHHYSELVDASGDQPNQRALWLLRRGYCKEQQGRHQFESADRDFEDVLAIDPTNAMAWAQRAYIQRSTGRASESLASIEKAIANRPDLGAFPYPGWLAETRGYVQLGLQQWQAAADSFVEAKRLGLLPDPQVSLFSVKALALLCIKTGQYEAYEKLRHELVDQFYATNNPQVAEFVAEIGVMRPFSQQDMDAFGQETNHKERTSFVFRMLKLSAFSKDMRLEQSSAWTTFASMIMRCSASGDFDPVTALERAIGFLKDTPAPREWLMLSAAKQRAGKSDDALELFRKADAWIQSEYKRPFGERNDLVLLQCSLLGTEVGEVLCTGFIGALDDPKVAPPETMRQELKALSNTKDRTSCIRRAKLILQLVLTGEPREDLGSAAVELGEIPLGAPVSNEDLLVVYYRGLALAAARDDDGFKRFTGELLEQFPGRQSTLVYNALSRTIALGAFDSKAVQTLMQIQPLPTGSISQGILRYVMTVLLTFQLGVDTTQATQQARTAVWNLLEPADRAKVELVEAARAMRWGDATQKPSEGFAEASAAIERLVQDETLHWSKRLELKILLEQARRAVDSRTAGVDE